MYPQTAMDRAHRAYGDTVQQPPAALLVQVHDGMVAKLALARDAILGGRIEERYTATAKVAAVIEALHLALDEDRGGDVARNLGQLYGYFIQRLQAINLQNDPGICDELIERLGQLRGAWASQTRPANDATDWSAAVHA